MIPPELLAQLGGGGGGMPAGPPPGPPPPPEAGGGGGAEGILRNIIDLAGQYREVERSEQSLLVMEKLRTMAQQLLSEKEGHAHDLMQGKVSPQALMAHA